MGQWYNDENNVYNRDDDNYKIGLNWSVYLYGVQLATFKVFAEKRGNQVKKTRPTAALKWPQTIKLVFQAKRYCPSLGI